MDVVVSEEEAIGQGMIPPQTSKTLGSSAETWVEVPKRCRARNPKVTEATPDLNSSKNCFDILGGSEKLQKEAEGTSMLDIPVKVSVPRSDEVMEQCWPGGCSREKGSAPVDTLKRVQEAIMSEAHEATRDGISILAESYGIKKLVAVIISSQNLNVEGSVRGVLIPEATLPRKASPMKGLSHFWGDQVIEEALVSTRENDPAQKVVDPAEKVGNLQAQALEPKAGTFDSLWKEVIEGGRSKCLVNYVNDSARVRSSKDICSAVELSVVLEVGVGEGGGLSQAPRETIVFGLAGTDPRLERVLWADLVEGNLSGIWAENQKLGEDVQQPVIPGSGRLEGIDFSRKSVSCDLGESSPKLPIASDPSDTLEKGRFLISEHPQESHLQRKSGNLAKGKSKESLGFERKKVVPIDVGKVSLKRPGRPSLKQKR
eukprot:Gb_28493 [translate_table: standard]